MVITPIYTYNYYFFHTSVCLSYVTILIPKK